jgi:hypothetical protein
MEIRRTMKSANGTASRMSFVFGMSSRCGGSGNMRRGWGTSGERASPLSLKRQPSFPLNGHLPFPLNVYRRFASNGFGV